MSFLRAWVCSLCNVQYKARCYSFRTGVDMPENKGHSRSATGSRHVASAKGPIHLVRHRCISTEMTERNGILSLHSLPAWQPWQLARLTASLV